MSGERRQPTIAFSRTSWIRGSRSTARDRSMMSGQDTWPNSWSSGRRAGDQEGMVQPVHSPGWRSHAGNPESESGRKLLRTWWNAKQYPKLDMPEAVIRQFASPPHRPKIVFLRSRLRRCRQTLATKITPCQFGGNPDCASADASIHGPGFHRRAQTGRNSLRRDHIQGLDQDWPNRAKSRAKYQARTRYGYCK